MSNIIFLEDGLNYLTDEEYTKLKNDLELAGISIKASKADEPIIKHSLFDNVIIYINENFTDLFVGGMLSPFMYDTFKSSIKYIWSRIKTKVKIFQSGQIRPAETSIKFKTKSGELIAPIPNDLNDVQFDKYMDIVKDGMSNLTLGETNSILQNTIILNVSDDNSLDVKTLYDYVKMKKEDKQ